MATAVTLMISASMRFPQSVAMRSVSPAASFDSVPEPTVIMFKLATHNQ
jgi:hypothetical protein